MKAKKLQKKKFKEKKSGFLKYNHEITGIAILALGLLVLLSFYFKQSVGIFGEFVKNMLIGLIGIPAYLIPPLIIIYAVFVIFKKDNTAFKLRILYSLIFLVLVSSLIQTATYDHNNYVNLSPLNVLVQFYKDGSNGGGVLGGIICVPLIAVLRTVGTIIILTALLIIDIILLTNISIVNFFKAFKELLTRLGKKISCLFKSDKKQNKVKKSEALLENGFEPDIIGDDDNLRLEFKSKPKIIDFKIQKASRELKEKTDVGIKDSNYIKENSIESAPEIQHTEYIVKDLQAITAKEVSRIKSGQQKNGQEQKKENKVPDNAGISVELQNNPNYKYPPLDLLNENDEAGKNQKNFRSTAIEAAKKLEDTLSSFGVDAKVINISRGPAVTRFELQPSPGVKVSKIVSLSDDISLNLAASGVRIEAPIPGKAAIGIEVPNKEVVPVYLKEVIESEDYVQYSSKLAFAIGKDISGDNIVADIAKMPHLLIAGATGSGKSVCINSLIISLLFKASPDEVKLLMVDPKVVELGIYNGIPHLLIPVVTDPRKAAGALNWAVQEMVNRYKLFADKGVRDIRGYNNMLKEAGENNLLPQIVIIIDELADLMMVAPNDVEDAICRLAQMARAAGMHLVIATQRPSVDVITGVIKANIPSRIAFAVSSQVDSRTILDMAGAEKLLGKGDMLYYPIGEPKPIRVKGAFVSDKEVERVVEFIKSQGNAEYDSDIIEEINSENEPVENNPGDKDELLPQAIELVVEAGQASVSLIQRRFKVGYARAARIVDQMEARGIVGPFEGSKPRQVLITKQQWQELQMADNQ